MIKIEEHEIMKIMKIFLTYMDKFIPSISLSSHISNSCMCCVCQRPSLSFKERSFLGMTKILLHVLGAMQ